SAKFQQPYVKTAKNIFLLLFSISHRFACCIPTALPWLPLCRRAEFYTHYRHFKNQLYRRAKTRGKNCRN
ncbi:hypothetical protein, partial [Gemmiger formicilis]|uniref:hypothetical protein n=2 Tax=Gemmiger formicilis TaxID=745368 RepID=UPI003A38DB93